MTIKRTLAAGFLASIVAFLFNLLTNGFLFSWVFLVMPADVWRVMTGLWYLWAVLLALMYGQILAFVYTILEESIPGVKLSKGVMFGLLVWLVSILPNSLTMLVTMEVAGFLVFYNILHGLALSVLLGIVIAEIVTTEKND
ncbi:hypothetical protein KY311_01875 [Candidatus Woesearchaeota archaeon]|nr:hypothetical protein [Candidatus Woesearchaeota archaeon]